MADILLECLMFKEHERQQNQITGCLQVTILEYI